MTFVKICGITNLEDAIYAADVGADLLGFIFYSKSPRYIAPDRAREIVRVVRHTSPAIRFVGVFVNESLDGIRAMTEQAELNLVQLHGDEPAEIVQALSPHAYKALRPRDANAAQSLLTTYRSAVNGNSPAFIVDSFDAKQYGGTGTRADWDIAASIAREFPILLAGGLSAENVAEAIRTVNPWGVDVSSGVERAPGLKDHTKVEQFIRAAKRTK